MLHHALLFVILLATTVYATCFIPGPSFPRPNFHKTDNSLKPLISRLDALVSKILSSSQDPSSKWAVNTTSFAVHLTSNIETIWSSCFTAPILGEYRDSASTPVTGNTIFRIASVTKVFTAYASLLQGGSWDASITDYVPELMGESVVSWDEITLRSLAGHLGGLIMDYGVEEIEDAVNLGFPPLSEKELALCHFDVKVDGFDCSRTQLLTGIRQRSPVFQPNDRSSYSNVGYAVLGMAVAAKSGISYEDTIVKSIIEPLGLGRTGFVKPRDAEGIIPSISNFWRTDLAIFAADGGIYSSANDISRFLRSILNSELLSTSQTNAWLKPLSFTQDLNSGWGAPWEILRTTKLSTDGRAIEIFHKSGGLPGYYSAAILIPEWNIGLTLLYAGDWQPIELFKEAALRIIGEEIEKIQRASAKDKYTGSYKATSNINSSLSLAVDAGPGIRIISWLSNSTDFLNSYLAIKQSQGAILSDAEVRLIPTGLTRGEGTEVWRVQTSLPKPKTPTDRIWEEYCMPHLDYLTYFDRPADEVVFEFVGGRVAVVKLTGLRVELAKEGEGDDGLIHADL